jgi:hypothetical protein
VDEGIGDVSGVVNDEQPDQAWLDGESPRWRLLDALAQGVIEAERRFRGSPAPAQPGAIDDNQTISGVPRAARPDPGPFPNVRPSDAAEETTP